MKKYKIKNCPSYMHSGTCKESIILNCYEWNNCPLKQIVEKCKEYTQYCKQCPTITCEDCKFSTNGLAQDILNILETEEVE